MEDQFGGRTDDDLFYDDFEPVDAPAISTETRQSCVPEPEAAPIASTAAEKAVEVAPAPTSNPVQPSRRTLASSRFADKPTTTTPAPALVPATETINQSTATADSPTKYVVSPTASASPVDAPVALSDDHHHQKPPRAPLQNTAGSAEARLKSGANLRQKLTEDELVDKMEKMKLLAAKKTRKFEMAEKDERQHAEAYARGMEEVRRRRAEDAERRRVDHDRRKLDDERARNRERKLKAMSIKDGGWDEGKEASVDLEARRGFRGANGGVRGTKTNGLGGGRFSRDPADRPDVDRFLDERCSSRGRGGRGGRSGEGGARGGINMPGRDRPTAPPPKPNNAVPALTTDVFPALPAGKPCKTGMDTSAAKAPAVLALPSPPPAGGKWDDEMELMDTVGKDT